MKAEEVKKIIEMANKDLNAAEIRKRLGLKPKAPLKRMYDDSLVETGKVKDILTEREVKKAAPGRRPVAIGKRGTMLLSRALLIGQFGLKEGDKFRVAKRGDSIILRRTE
jgi:bifunctional DNA-binding transcriptional regulator/antitoxin component of YhaV-PrlF toxin-antitoxin module